MFVRLNSLPIFFVEGSLSMFSLSRPWGIFLGGFSSISYFPRAFLGPFLIRPLDLALEFFLLLERLASVISGDSKPVFLSEEESERLS